MCSSWWFCTQSKSRHETSSVFRRFWLPLHGRCPSTTLLLDRNVRSRPESWNTWSLCTMKKTTQHGCEHLFLDFIDYVDCCISLSLSLLKQTFRSFVVSWAIRLGAFLIRVINNYCLSHCFCSPQTFIKSTIKKMSKCKKRNRIFKVWALYIIFV